MLTAIICQIHIVAYTFEVYTLKIGINILIRMKIIFDKFKMKMQEYK